MRLIPLAGLVGLVLTAPLQAQQNPSQEEDAMLACKVRNVPALLVVAALATCTPPTPTQVVLNDPEPPSPSFETTTDLNPIEDTFIRENSANDNNGNQDRMRIKGKISNSRVHRGLVRFDQQEIVNAVGSETLQSATLEFTVNSASGWGGSGRYVGVHRMTQAWSELGATWNCADDTDRTNSTLDCASGDLWDMEASPSSLPFVETPTDSMLVLNSSVGGTISVDVTSDVAAFLSGSETNLGWLVVKRTEDTNGDIEISSRSGNGSPRLTIISDSNDPPPIPDNLSFPADTLFTIQSPSNPGTSYLRRQLRVEFTETATAEEIQGFFDQHGAVIVGGAPANGAYYVQIPDPGTDWAVFQAKIIELQSPGFVKTLFPISISTVKRFGRYPQDNAGRAAWFSSAIASTAGLNPYLAIRAPEAWACENGQYGGTPPRIGLLELNYGASSADLNYPRAYKSGAFRSISSAEADADRVHGTAMAGIIAARGDNDTGTHGMLWAPPLVDLYALGAADGDLRPVNLTLAFADGLVPEITEFAPRILSISVAWGIPTTDFVDGKDEFQILADAYEELLLTVPTLQVFQAAGNDTIVHNTSQVVEGDSRAALGFLKLEGGLGDRIVFVTGTNEGGALWGEADFWLGHTDIAAPAGGPFQFLDELGGAFTDLRGGGTSGATALTAGVAAQLVTMDPTLSPAEVLDYLKRGAMVPKFDSTGSYGVPDSIAGAPEAVYRLDAFGALSLLSAERPGTPVCGYPIAVDQGTLFFERNAFIATGDSTSVTTGANGDPSIANGGREIAVGDELFDQNGSLTGTVPDIDRRQYLEKGWADYRFVNGVYDVRVTPEGGPPGNWNTVMQGASIGAFPLTGVSSVAVSPLGDRMIFQGDVLDFNNCAVFERERAAIWNYNFTTGSLAIPWDSQCSPFDTGTGNNSSVAWHPEGDRAAVFTGRFEGLNEFTRITLVIPGGAPTITIPFTLYNSRYAFGGQMIISEEGSFGSGICERTIRRDSGNLWVLQNPPGAIPVPLRRCRNQQVTQQSQIVAESPPVN